MGANANGNAAGNVRPRPQGFGAAVVLCLELSRQRLPGELSGLGAVRNGGLFFHFEHFSDVPAPFHFKPKCIMRPAPGHNGRFEGQRGSLPEDTIFDRPSSHPQFLPP